MTDDLYDILITLEKPVKEMDVQHKEQTNKESVENPIYVGI